MRQAVLMAVVVTHTSAIASRSRLAVTAPLRPSGCRRRGPRCDAPAGELCAGSTRQCRTNVDRHDMQPKVPLPARFNFACNRNRHESSMPPPPRSEQPDEAPAELQQLALLPEALLLRDAGCASEGSGVPRLWRATCGGEQVLVRAWEPCGSAGELLQQLRALQRMSRQSKHCARILGATLLDGRRPAAVLQPGGAPLLVPPGGLAAAEALRWGAAVAKALAALHALGLVAHGCLEQIHISDTGETILAGFWLDDLGSETVQQPPAVPAQHGGRHADIHAFGLLLLQLLTGRPLATEGAPPQAAAAKMLQAIQPPLPAQLLQELASLLQRCLEAPASRPAAAELLEELEELQALQAAYRCPGHPGLGSQPLSEAPMLARWLLDCDADSPCGAPGSASGGGGPPDAACWASAGRPQLAGAAAKHCARSWAGGLEAGTACKGGDARVCSINAGRSDGAGAAWAARRSTGRHVALAALLAAALAATGLGLGLGLRRRCCCC